jgi:hypothetical protein
MELILSSEEGYSDLLSKISLVKVSLPVETVAESMSSNAPPSQLNTSSDSHSTTSPTEANLPVRTAPEISGSSAHFQLNKTSSKTSGLLARNLALQADGNLPFPSQLANCFLLQNIISAERDSPQPPNNISNQSLISVQSNPEGATE